MQPNIDLSSLTLYIHSLGCWIKHMFSTQTSTGNCLCKIHCSLNILSLDHLWCRSMWSLTMIHPSKTLRSTCLKFNEGYLQWKVIHHFQNVQVVFNWRKVYGVTVKNAFWSLRITHKSTILFHYPHPEKFPLRMKPQGKLENANITQSLRCCLKLHFCLQSTTYVSRLAEQIPV